MFKSCNYLTTIIFLFLATNLFAQDNSIKIGFSDALLGHYNLNYERNLGRNNSVQFKLGYLKPTTSPFISEETITPGAYNLIEVNGGISTSVEYRFYISQKRSPEGFYIAPYLRYFNQAVDYTDEIENYQFNVDSRLNTIGIGGQLGYQWVFNEIFSVDLYFFGAGLDYHMGKLEYMVDPKPDGFDYGMVTSHVDDVFTDIDYLHKRLNHEVNEDNHTTKLPFLFPGLRMGFNVGVAF